MNDVASRIRELADRVRVVAQQGLRYSEDKPYDRDRYEHLVDIAAELFAAVDVRDADEIKRTLFREVTHVSPMSGSEAAVFDDRDRLLLIRRADNNLWALPGGLNDMGETAAEAAVREAREEAGVVAVPTALVGVWDSRLCGTLLPLQLYHFVVHCHLGGALEGGASTPWEVVDQGWFDRSEAASLQLSPGHPPRVAAAYDFHSGSAQTYIDL